MKRNIVIATVTAAALITGGTATAFAVSGEDSGQAKRSSVQVADRDDDGDDHDSAAEEKADRAEDKAEDKAERAEDKADDKTDRADDKADRDDDKAEDARDAREDDAQAKAAKVSVSEAISAALKASPGTVTSAELDAEGSDLAWEIDVLAKDNTWHDVTIDAGNAKVLNQHQDRDDDGAADARNVRKDLKGSGVDARDAAQAAQSRGTVTSVDLDDDNATTAWEVEVQGKDGKQQDLRVDLKTGKVTTAPADHDDDSDDDSSDLDN
ncbi:PepSY domain-containing protein [Streptomyces sp. H27-D2]|uniref:PepSY domain-containing protein n=1 Tax=Streptomyces sp. H27-D2 TaxID=3046304 RepID=UPI002DBE8C84|nr:PepSY domain-containing protein [Streptomyces sp. H27-D2]MEC4018408.1 PepSY domain-containing protein [Streptomyces sp. H27-D2]